MMPTHTPLQAAADEHAAVQLLLPWYLKKALGASEQQQVDLHVRTCLSCRRELQAIARLAETVAQTSDLDTAAEASFAAIRAKLPAVRQLAPANKRRRTLPWRGATLTARAQALAKSLPGIGKPVALAAAILLTLLPMSLQERALRPTGGYYTLSAGQPAAADGIKLRVVFNKDVSERRVQELLTKIHGRLLGKPNSLGAYTVQLDAAGADPAQAALAVLKDSREVVFAEPALGP